MTQHLIYHRILSWLSVLCLSLWSIHAIAQIEQQTTFATQQPYADDQQITKTLQIPGAEELVVNVQGITEECCDYLRIFDSSGRQIREYRGTIREQFFVKGSAIRLFFFSDGRTTAQGVKVSIDERSLASVFQEIKTALLNAARIIMETGTQPALTEINRQLDSLKNLYAEASRATEINAIIMRVTLQLQAIARVYRNIASSRLTILQQHQQQFERIDRLQKETKVRIGKLEQNKQRYLTLLNEAQQKLANSQDGVEKQKLQFSIEGYKSIAQSMHIQQSIWESFHRAQQELTELLQTHSRKIEVLFYLLDINAKIYEQAANTASLRQSTMINLNDMIDQTEFQRIIQAIADNEKTLQSLITRIEQTNFQ
jgi:hypothetical protein